ncbi:hypothetical protein NE237_010746 [Protea cynaroides]|uniref:Uncharacterized protein n=1 Tax=Protea cynaroides TaxID=273540 RepID=A0A9Q0L0U1_9MAGN|nr:hypothetical protein NE237_010746 [Protea cynaroides]
MLSWVCVADKCGDDRARLGVVVDRCGDGRARLGVCCGQVWGWYVLGWVCVADRYGDGACSAGCVLRTGVGVVRALLGVEVRCGDGANVMAGEVKPNEKNSKVGRWPYLSGWLKERSEVGWRFMAGVGFNAWASARWFVSDVSGEKEEQGSKMGGGVEYTVVGLMREWAWSVVGLPYARGKIGRFNEGGGGAGEMELMM